MNVAVLIEKDAQALGLARALGASTITAIVIGADPSPLIEELGAAGASRVVQARHDALSDYAPEAWGDALAEIARTSGATAVVATGTERGNEVLAHVAAILDAPFAANVIHVRGAEITRVRWGGSLVERVLLDAPVVVLSAAEHAFDDAHAAGPVSPVIDTVDVDLPPDAARTCVVDRVSAPSGIDLTSAAVVVSGGRGVGSAEGFAVLEDLASLLGGAVGCSRVATNNGWRPHRDQVGQTGKRIAPQLYIACGISGAIQHWVGMMAAKHVLAINTDAQANMVGRAEYAVVGDLHEVVPAIAEEIRRRRARTEVG